MKNLIRTQYSTKNKFKKEGLQLETVSLILQLRACTADRPLLPLLRDSMQELERMKIAKSHHLPRLDRNGSDTKGGRLLH